MIYSLVYHPRVVSEDIPRLGPNKDRIGKSLFEKLSTQPAIFGQALRGDLKGYRKLRIGHYRVIYKVEEELVKVDKIGHRSSVYKEAMSRLRNL